MAEIAAKDLYRQVINELLNLYEEREVNALAKHYLHDRFHVDAMKLALNSPIHYDPKLLAHDLKLLRAATPLQHVVGFGEFFGRRFKCTPAALIPRPETEELVEWIVSELVNRKSEIGNQEKAIEGHPELFSGASVLDIGTGTGCIPISISLVSPDSKVTGYDISKEAISLARQNNEMLKATVEFQQHDILAEEIPENRFDIIVSNPPYIPEVDKVKMHSNVLQHEPDLALFVKDEDPLLFYRVIAEKAKLGLKKEGLLFFEIHESYGNEVMKLLGELNYTELELRQDINGKDRMIKAKNQ